MGRCVEILEITAVSIGAGTSAIITVAPTILENKGLYAIRYNIRWNGALGNEPLTISNGASPVPVTANLGNSLLLSQIGRPEWLYIIYSALSGVSPTIPHFVYCNRLCPTFVRTPPVV